jgi:sugar-specific transcriptional regulator TrmB
MIEELESLGLTKGESKVYWALLEIGECTVGALLKEAKVSHSKIYDILERLSDKGLVTIIKKHNTQHFLANKPESLKDLLNEKRKEIDEREKILDNIMPELQTKLEYAGTKDEITIFEGKSGVRRFSELIFELMKPDDTFYLIGTPKSTYKVMGEYFTGWQARRVQKKIAARMLFSEEARDRGEKRKDLPKTKIKFIPNDLAPEALTEMFGDYFAIMVIVGKPMVIMIKNKIIANSYKKQFEYLWKIAKE